MRSAWAVVLVLLLAGCSGTGNHNGKTQDTDFTPLGLQATDTTGVIRGVVFDSAIRPLADVAISITGDSVHNSTTKDDGLFGFDGLAAGTYFVQAAKPGFSPVQQSVDVVAGVRDPPVVKILMPADNSTAPHETTYLFQGYIQCSVSFVAAGLAACALVGVGDDNTQVSYPPETVPDYAQSEMAWKSTQAASPNLLIAWSRAVPNQTLLDNWEQDSGASPLLLQADRARIDEVHLGSDLDTGGGGPTGSLYIRVFNAPVDGTNPTCVPRPVLGGCTTGVGATVQQQFSVVTNLFYGYAPPADWRYDQSGPYPPPG